MASTMIRIRPQSHRALKKMAAASGQSLQDVLDRAIEEHERKLYLDGVEADYAALKRDPKAWAEFQKEIAIWDVTNLDGLDGL